MSNALEDLIKNSPRLRPESKANYRHAVASFLAFAGTNPATWTVEVAEAWRNELAKKQQPQTTNAYVKRLKSIVRRWAQRTRQFDFAAPVEYLQAKPERRQALTVAEARTLVATCKGNSVGEWRDRTILILGFRTGMRRGGLLSLSFEGVDPGTRRIKYQDKGGAKRELPPLDPEAWNALEHWMVSRPAKDRRGPIFRVSPVWLWRSLKDRATEIGLGHRFSPHVMRHTFVTWCRELGIPDHVIMLYSGHTAPGGQLNTYTSSLFTYRDTPIQKIPSLLTP